MPSITIADTFHALKNMDEDFASYLVMVLVGLVVFIMLSYYVYLTQLERNECVYMKTLYAGVDGNIRPINATDPDCSGNLYDYYIKTAYNACSGGSYKNDFVDLCNLRAVLGEGVRGIDLEIFSVDNQPVVSTSTSSSYFVKETFNSVNFSDVMRTIVQYGFASATSPNYTDPIILHLRVQSNNQAIYTAMANIFESYDAKMMGKRYSYENDGTNFGQVPLLSMCGKIVLIVDRTNTAFLENEAFLEYVNLTSNSVFMRSYHYFDVQNNPDIEELAVYNKRDMTIVFPDTGVNPSNPSGMLCRELGCQMVAMRYQYVDNYLEENALFFDRVQYAFALKPARLRYSPIILPDPEPQNPNYYYDTRTVSGKYYSFNI